VTRRKQTVGAGPDPRLDVDVDVDDGRRRACLPLQAILADCGAK